MNRLILKKIKFIAFLILLQGVVSQTSLYGQGDWCCCEGTVFPQPPFGETSCLDIAVSGGCHALCDALAILGYVGAGDDDGYPTEAACQSDAGSPCFILPVELVDFSAKAIENTGIQLKWTTETELNNEGFVIERGNQDLKWETISFQIGNGTTNEIHNYDFIDKNPFPGVNYYRLKQMDFDGAYEYSETIIVDLKETRGSLSVFPSLAKDKVVLSFVEEPAEIPVVCIFDLMGKKVYETQEDNRIINVSELQPGQYIITVSTNREVWTERFVKVN